MLEENKSPLFSNENVWRLEKTLAQISPWGLLHFATSPERLAAARQLEHANMSPKRKKSRGGVCMMFDLYDFLFGLTLVGSSRVAAANLFGLLAKWSGPQGKSEQ